MSQTSQSHSQSSQHYIQQQQQQHQHSQVCQHSQVNQVHQVDGVETKYGPPSARRPPYHVMLELLETTANGKLVLEYGDEICRFLSQIEAGSGVNPAMIDLQPEIQWFMRPFLLDFLVELHQSFRLQPQTLFLCLNIIDRYCAKRIVFKRHYQLVGCTALWIAGKYEDKKSRVPTLRELSIMCRHAYDEEMFVQMEMHILSTLEWSLSHANLEECLQLAISWDATSVAGSGHGFSYGTGYETGYGTGYGSLVGSIAANTSTSTSSTSSSRLSNSRLNTRLNTRLNNKVSAITAVGRFLCELSLYDRFFLSVPSSLVSITANLIACSMLQVPNAAQSLTSLIKLHQQSGTLDPANGANGSNSTIDFGSGGPHGAMGSDEPHDPNGPKFDENMENRPPKIEGAFLSGFDLHSLNTIRKICLMFMVQLGKVTEVLSKKYEELGVMQVVKNFNSRHSFPISVIYDTHNLATDLAIHEIPNTKLCHIADYLLQLSDLFNGKPKENHPVPLTPPSANSQYSVFSHKNLTSTCVTPASSYIPSSERMEDFSPMQASSCNSWSSPAASAKTYI